jgi:hypothetical protein
LSACGKTCSPLRRIHSNLEDLKARASYQVNAALHLFSGRPESAPSIALNVKIAVKAFRDAAYYGFSKEDA